MSTIKATHISHPSASSPNFTLGSDQKTTFNGPVVGSGLDLITSQTFSGVSSFSVDNVFSSEYDNYLIFFRVVATGNEILLYRWRSGGTNDSTASSYRYQRFGVDNSTILTAQGAADSGRIGDMGQNPTTIVANISGPFLSEGTGLIVNSNYSQSSKVLFTSYGGFHTVNSSFDGATFFPTSGTITGTARVYGYKD